jgi:hypothetical protein
VFRKLQYVAEPCAALDPSITGSGPSFLSFCQSSETIFQELASASHGVKIIRDRSTPHNFTTSVIKIVFGSFSKMTGRSEPNRSGIEPSAVILNGFVPYVLQFISQELHFVSQEATLCFLGSRAIFEL